VKKCLITGIAGFVGSYLRPALFNQYNQIELHGIHRSGEKGTHSDYNRYELDIRDSEAISNLIYKIKPDLIFHLAAQPFVPKAISDPWETLDINVKGTLNILEALKRLERPCRMVYISSADVYGKQNDLAYPLNESILPNPINPYSASKYAAEIYCRQYANLSNKLEIMIARPFNHIGVGQRKEFVVPNFCQQIVDATTSKKNSIMVGDISATRDFLDVRDVVQAYLDLASHGVSGEVYNICSGVEISIESVLKEIIQISGKEIQIQRDPSRLRPSENLRLVGMNQKIKNLGWNPKFPLRSSLEQIFQSIHQESSPQIVS
jgi:GDP-4-dehydro-6-deoxy-D-mannose reductase